MDNRKIEQPIKQFLKNLASSIEVEEVIVFGSYVDGNATEDSDVDILVISDDFKQMDEDQRLRLLHNARPHIEPFVDPWGFTKAELEQASHLTTLGYAREDGFRFL